MFDFTFCIQLYKNIVLLSDAIISTQTTKVIDESNEETTIKESVTETSDKILVDTDKNENDDEYEIVRSDECDDGEWIYVESESTKSMVNQNNTKINKSFFITVCIRITTIISTRLIN